MELISFLLILSIFATGFALAISGLTSAAHTPHDYSYKLGPSGDTKGPSIGEVSLAQGDTVIPHCHWLALAVIP
jgi:hypothetical protein